MSIGRERFACTPLQPFDPESGIICHRKIQPSPRFTMHNDQFFHILQSDMYPM